MKKIFLLGDYTAFTVGGIKFFKEKEDFMVVTLTCEKTYRHAKQIMLESVKYIKNTDYIPGPYSYSKYFKQEKPDFLAVVSGHQLVDKIGSFNGVKLFCEENNADLVVIQTNTRNSENMVCITPLEIYDKVNSIITREPQ